MDYKWLGPYKVVKVLSKGFFTLRSNETDAIIERIHGAHLKVYNNPRNSIWKV